MNFEAAKNSCPLDEIAAYIDGELSPERELNMDLHFAGCPACTTELTRQKQFLCSLNSTLKNEGEIELPANFTKLIVANAESSVSGLRRPRERYNAIFICAGLSLFVLFAMGAESGKAMAGVSLIVDQVAAVGLFVGQLVYSVLVGVVIILRSVGSRFRVDAVVIAVVAGFSAMAILFLSRRLRRIRRA